MEDQLKYIFQNINDWLKYGEAKNGALVALNLTSLLGAADKLMQGVRNDVLEWALIFFFVFSIFSLLCCLASYLPKVKPPERLLGFMPKPNKHNVLYYADLSHLSADDLLSEVAAMQTPPHAGSFSHFEKALAAQIICNSTIATIKYEFFTIALWFTATAFVTPFITAPAIFYLYRKK